jgi:hypothetical protein
MFESPFVYALVFFVLGLIAGIIVAVLFQAGKSSSSVGQAENDLERIPIPSPNSMKSIPEQIENTEQAQARVEGGGVLKSSSPAQDPVTWVSSLSDEPSLRPEQVRASPIESFLHSVRSSTVKEPSQPKTMAAEIDAIIREKLPGSNLSGRIVRIEEQPDFGLLVVVDGKKYEGVNAVPDEDVRDFIKSAVAEWQDRSSSTTSA